MTATADESRVPAVSIIIVNWNTRSLLAACLAGLETVSTSGFAEVLVIDNASTDDSVDMCRSEFPWVRLMVNETNLGFGVANNMGVAASLAPICLLLNSDTVVPAGVVEQMVASIRDDPTLGALGCRLIGANGDIQRSWMLFPKLPRLLAHETCASRLSSRLPGMFIEPPTRQSPGRCDWIYGAAMFVRREAFDAVSGFDPAIWMYSEEMDLCYRMKLRGWEVGYDPRCVIYHLGEGSWGRDAATPLFLRYRGLLRFYARYHRAAGLPLAAVTVMFGLSLRSVGWLLATAAAGRDDDRRRAALRRSQTYLNVVVQLGRDIVKEALLRRRRRVSA